MSTSLVLLALPVLWVLAGVYLLWHNERVYRSRMQMLQRISAAATHDIDEGRYDWEWRYAEFHDPEYMQQFWALRKPTWPRDPARAER